MARSAAQIIKAKGGTAAFAESIGVTAANVRVMKHRNCFAPGTWPAILRAHPDIGLDLLSGLYAAYRDRQARKQKAA